MATLNWRGLINRVIYSLMYTRQLDDQVVNQVADMILKERGLTGGAQAYHDALSEAIKAGQLPDTVDSAHSEPALLEFFRKLRDRLDSQRPWQPPPWTLVPIGEWDNEPQRAIARIDLTPMQVSSQIPTPPFSSLPHGDGSLVGLLLRLANGQAVGLLGGAEKDSRVTVLQRGEGGDPIATIEAFAEATGIPRENITPLVS